MRRGEREKNKVKGPTLSHITEKGTSRTGLKTRHHAPQGVLGDYNATVSAVCLDFSEKKKAKSKSLPSKFEGGAPGRNTRVKSAQPGFIAQRSRDGEECGCATKHKRQEKGRPEPPLQQTEAGTTRSPSAALRTSEDTPLQGMSSSRRAARDDRKERCRPLDKWRHVKESWFRSRGGLALFVGIY